MRGFRVLNPSIALAISLPAIVLRIQAKRQRLRANSFLQSFQLALHRTVVNRAADAEYGAAEKRCVLPVFRADFLTGQLCNLRLDLALFSVAEFAGAGDSRFRKAQARVQFLFELRNDWIKKMHSAVIDQDRDKISNLLRNSVALGDCVQYPALLLGGDCGILPHPAQIGTCCQQAPDHAQFYERTVRVYSVTQEYV